MQMHNLQSSELCATHIVDNTLGATEYAQFYFFNSKWAERQLLINNMVISC